MTPITGGKPFVVACLVDFREKTHAQSLHAISNASKAYGKWNEKTHHLDVA